MPFFQYQATDKQGNPIQGTVQAGSLDEANHALKLQGYKVSGMRDPSVMASPPLQHAMAPPLGVYEQPVVRPRAPTPSAQVRPGDIRKSRYSKESEIFFIFSQLASYFKAGISPSQAFKDIGEKQRREDFREALLLVSSRTTEGGNIADNLALYPYLFPPHVVGTVRAGETGGYLPEALESIAAQSDSSRKMRRWMVWLGWFAIGIPPVIPIGRALFKSVLASWSVQDASGGTTPVAPLVWSGFVKEMTGPFGIASLIVFVLFIGLAFAWQAMWFRSIRHRLALMVPTIGKRAYAESFAAFTWNLSRLSRAAIPPRQSFQLATETVPNMQIREALELQGKLMNDKTKLSYALHATKMLPYELSAMVQTGEVTGDVAGQLMNGSMAQQEEFEHQSKNLTNRVGCWMALLFFCVGPLVLTWLYRDFLLGLFDVIGQE